MRPLIGLRLRTSANYEHKLRMGSYQAVELRDEYSSNIQSTMWTRTPWWQKVGKPWFKPKPNQTWGEADAGAWHNPYFTFCLLILMFFVANLYIRYLPSSYPQYLSRFSTVLRIVYVFPS
jgi:hypothetical protein